MRFPRPKSLTSLLVLGFILVAAPLILAIARAATQMNQFAAKSEELVIQGVKATDQNQSLRKQLSSVERSAKVYRVIGESELLEAYQERLQRLLETLDEIANDSKDNSRIQQIRDLRLRIQEFNSIMRIHERDSPELVAAIEGLEALNDAVDDMSEDSNRFIDMGLNALQDNAKQVQRTLAIQTALLVPFTLLVIVVFTALMARPLRQIDRAISALGDRQFSKPIKVSGPEDLETLGRQLEWLRERLIEQEKEKDKFLRHMSHELKTPLANIREGAELLMDGAVGELRPSQKEVADILRQNSLSLQKLIENLLSFSAWQSKVSIVEPEKFDLSELIRNIIDQQRLSLTSQDLSVKYTLAEIEVVADKSKIRMVIDNLLSNAIKFSPNHGAVYVTTKDQGNACVIEIADEGPGIDARERARVFEPFYQGSAAQTGHVKGTGIGLSVVLECVVAHGGKISIIDGAHSGAHFEIILPMVPTVAVAA